MSETILLLCSLTSMDLVTNNAQKRVEDVMLAKKLKFDIIDGADTNNKLKRDELFNISKLNPRAKYPQIFIVNNDQYHFIGSYDEIESLIDCESLPSEILESNPDIKTFSKVYYLINSFYYI
jgi:hypothetical protein